MKRILNNPEWKNFLKELDRDPRHWDVFFKKLSQDSQAASIEESVASPIDKSFFADMPHFKKPFCLLSLLCDFIFFIQKLYSTTNESKGHFTQPIDLKNVICFIYLLACYLIEYHEPKSFTCIPRLTQNTLSIVKDAKALGLKILREKHALVIENQSVLNAAIDEISSIIIEKKLLAISNYNSFQLWGEKKTACNLLADTDLFDQFSLILKSISPIAEFMQHQSPLYRLKIQTPPATSPALRSEKKQGLAPSLEYNNETVGNTSGLTSTMIHPIKKMLYQFPFNILIFFIIAVTQIQLIAAQTNSRSVEKSPSTNNHPLTSFITLLCFYFLTNIQIRIATQGKQKTQPNLLLLEDKPCEKIEPITTIGPEETRLHQQRPSLEQQAVSLTPDQEKALASVIQQLEDYTSLNFFSWRHHKTAIRKLLDLLGEKTTAIAKIETIVKELNTIAMEPNGHAHKIKQAATELRDEILNPIESINTPAIAGSSI